MDELEKISTLSDLKDFLDNIVYYHKKSAVNLENLKIEISRNTNISDIPEFDDFVRELDDLKGKNLSLLERISEFIIQKINEMGGNL